MKPTTERIELHLHTKYSTEDSVIAVDDALLQASVRRQKAVAITDYMSVQAFPSAARIAQKIGIKVVYGAELKMTDADAETVHITLLAQNQIGLRHLYELITLAHTTYNDQGNSIPRHEIERLREGLLIGSGCLKGVLYQKAQRSASAQELAEAAAFFDYIELLPYAEPAINVALLAAADANGLPAAAVGNAHYVDPEDALARAVLLEHNRCSTDQPPLHLRSTEEMRAAFSYLPPERIDEVVISNPAKIVDQIEKLQPLPEGIRLPAFPGDAQTLSETVYRAARARYGEPLHPVVAARLEAELGIIADHGYAIYYNIARKLVEHSRELGYPTSARGTVGSMLTAYLLELTAADPLPPYYRCPQCKKVEFLPEGEALCGLDLPDRPCSCGGTMQADGHNIPFESFCGINGSKVPDIDLNFSDECQAEMHDYARTLFAPNQICYAGTIATFLQKNANELLQAYLMNHSIPLDKREQKRIVDLLIGVKRCCGYQPGSLMIFPQPSPFDVSPIQKPARLFDPDVISTHFQAYELRSTILKLDLLGHAANTLLKKMEELSGVPHTEIVLNDPALYQFPFGTLGIFELDNPFAQKLIHTLKPTCFSDLMLISGFSHGTDVWYDNAENLILSGCHTPQETIAFREDVFQALLRYGLSRKYAYYIMEQVYKGRGNRLDSDALALMRSHGVPHWFIESCRKIKYLFPKAHAAAYCMSTVRLAYYKLHHPTAFYAALLSCRPEETEAIRAEAKQRGIELN
ncbi:MAG: PHP domain-containing protein [Clostridia bacterium]|nr:PHP domain-containing protein [Clostridia bacterium]